MIMKKIKMVFRILLPINLNYMINILMIDLIQKIHTLFIYKNNNYQMIKMRKMIKMKRTIGTYFEMLLLIQMIKKNKINGLYVKIIINMFFFKKYIIKLLIS